MKAVNHSKREKVEVKMGRKETVFKYFNEQKEYTKDRVALGIEKNRKGFAELSIKDQKGNL